GAGGLSGSGGRDVEHAFSRLLHAGAVNGVDSELARQDPSDRSEHPTLELAVIRRVEKNDGACGVAVIGRLLLVLDAVQRVDCHPRLGRGRLARELLPFLDAVPVVGPEVVKVLAARGSANAYAVDDDVVPVDGLVSFDALQMAMRALEEFFEQA